jgi:thermolysin
MITTFLRNKVYLIQLVMIILPLLLAATVTAAPNGNARGFKALTGQAAGSYRLPLDVIQVRQRSVGPNLTSRRYQQVVNGAQVLGGQLSVVSDAQGNVKTVIGAHYPNLLTTNDINLTAANAQAKVARKIGGTGKWFNHLMLNPKTGRYFYRVENRRADSRWFYWIDAENGNVLNAYDGLAHGDGMGVTGDIKDLTGLTSPAGNGFQLVSQNDRIKTYDARNRNRLPGNIATDDDDSWDLPGSTSPGQAALVDAHFYANVTDSYYQTIHSFDWLSYFPQGIVSSAHVQRNYNNAYWNGEQMAYGDGDGSRFINFSGDLDVVGHELSHGVTDATSNLIYQNESGALNEAFSDIMGTNIEYFNDTGNWTIGEDITVGSNGIRNMADPNEDGDPSHYADRYTGTADNGGVHWNSGIANHWYYILVTGSPNANQARATGNTLNGIGMAAAETIAFMGFTSLNATATFCDAREATIAIADSHATDVTNAWDEVGVTDSLCSGGGDGGSGGGGGTAGDPLISNVESATGNGIKFEITWSTDIPSDSTVIFNCCGSYSNAELVTSHKMKFTGSKGVLYEYYVTSTTPDGGSTTAGPFQHQN